MKKVYYLVLVAVIIALIFLFLLFDEKGYFGISKMVDDASTSIDDFIMQNSLMIADYNKNTLILSDCDNVDCEKIPKSNCQINDCLSLREDDRIVHVPGSVCPIYRFFTDSRLAGITKDTCKINPVYGQITIMPVLPNKDFEFKGSSEFFALLHFDGLYDVDDYVAQIGSFYYKNNEDALFSFNETIIYLEDYLGMDNIVLLDYDSYDYYDGMITATFMTDYLYRNVTSRPSFHFVMYLDKNKIFLYREYSPYIYPRYNYENSINNRLISDVALMVSSLYLENYHANNYSTIIIDGTGNNAKCPFSLLELSYEKDASMLCNNQSYYGLMSVNPLFRQDKISDTIKNSPEYSIIIGVPYDNSDEVAKAFLSLKNYSLGNELFLDFEEDEISMVSINQHGNEWNDFFMTTQYTYLEEEDDYFMHMIIGRKDNIILFMVEKNNMQSRKYYLGRTTRNSESISDFVIGRMQMINELSVSMIE